MGGDKDGTLFMGKFGMGKNTGDSCGETELDCKTGLGWRKIGLNGCNGICIGNALLSNAGTFIRTGVYPGTWGMALSPDCCKVGC